MSDPAKVEWSVAKPFVLPWTVSAEDIDDLDHVSNVRFLHYMNLAAKAHSEALGYDVARYREEGGVFVVRRHEIEYLEPALLGDELLCGTWPSGLRRSVAERRHEIRRARDGKLVTRGFNVWVFVDFTRGRPRRVPDTIAETFDPAQFGA